MSKENVALFVRMTATKRDISTRASSERSTHKWIELGKEVGLSEVSPCKIPFPKLMVSPVWAHEGAVQKARRAANGCIRGWTIPNGRMWRRW